MNVKPSPVLIGGFIVGAVALTVVMVLLFASGVFSISEKNMIFFEGSVNGLNVGAPVKLKGVAVGKVTDILVIYDDLHGKIITPVIVEFSPRKVYDMQGGHFDRADPEDIKRLVAQGLRAQLQLQSLLTGQLFVDINFKPGTPLNLLGGDNPPYPEIPSIPSPKDELENTIVSVMSQIRKMPIQETFMALHDSMVQVEKLLKSPHIVSSLESLDLTLKNMRQLVQHLDQTIGPLASGVQGSLKSSKALLDKLDQGAGPVLGNAQATLKATTATMEQARSTLATIDQAASQNASLDLALKELTQAAKSLRVLADYLERHPDALLYGKKAEGE